MSRELLENLNGNKTGQFHQWLNYFEGEPRIAWYPSSGTDFRDLLYLHSEFSIQNPASKSDLPAPDIFLHTDYFPWKSSTFLDTPEIYRDKKTSVTVKSIEELDRCDFPLDDQMVDFEEGSVATGRVLFLEVEVFSTVLGNYSYPVVYAFVDNASFCAEKMLPLHAHCSHIVHIRFGGGLGGGGKSTGVWLLNVLQKLHCEVFVTDSMYGHGHGDDRIYELYPELSGIEDVIQLDQIRKIDGELWSNYGDVSWNFVNSASDKKTSLGMSSFEQVFDEHTKEKQLKSSDKGSCIDTWDHVIHSISGCNHLVLAGGVGGNILRSSDSGLTWEEQSLDDSEYTSQSVFVVNESDCLVLSNLYSEGGGITLFKSNDGGKQWKKIPIPIDNLSSLFMLNERIGIASGMDHVARTEDGGETWNIVEEFDEISFETIKFYDDKNGLIIGQYQGDEIPLRDCIITTSDAGLSWKKKLFDHNYDLRDCQYISKNRYYLLGNSHDLGTNLLLTNDNGASFTEVIANHEGWLGAFQFFGEGCGVVVGEKEDILVTVDNGKKWLVCSSPLEEERCLSSAYVGDDFIIVGGQGLLLRSDFIHTQDSSASRKAVT